MPDDSTDSTNEDRFRAEAAVGEDGSDGPPTARLGGNPMLPREASGPPSPFVASIDCAALPPGGTDLPLPSEGHLLLFADPADRRQGAAPGEVVYVPAGSPAVARPVGEHFELAEELDAGVIHWVIRHRDLAALRFDRVHRYTDMA
ncbi:DUF1963 domain-containing protein [Nocardiopsis chromatogenes]|uniref:DUF1963 domain-containing protein n=1 Tax=Nocardiopsis chromatogenes TaxID=280239 RepID=UPI00034832FD|nr:DUF1963 domain-containing protein [Nocardiopsis chromatogenes]